MKTCDIIIPIYNAYDCIKECIDSVIKNTDFKSTRLILIDDSSPDDRVLPLLYDCQKENPDKIIILKNAKNLGFVKTVNRGMKYSKNDILLLNSDTIVAENWLEKIKKCAYANSTIATVTPFSNNLTPMTPLPENFRKKGFPDGYNFTQMARLVDKCSMRIYPEIPTSHGFCMYIKRSAIDNVGYFDEKTFGKGYGEENDFCFRCLKRGLKHIFCDDVYVLHKGSQSFLDKKEFHNDELANKHPEIMKKVGEWYNGQCIKEISDNIKLAIGTKNKKINILILSQTGLSKEQEKLINDLRAGFNFHILSDVGGSYELHSFFKDVDLITAIYEKTKVVWGDNSGSKEYKKMVDEITKIFGISIKVIDSEIDKKALLKKCEKSGEKREINFANAQKKMLQYDFTEKIINNIAGTNISLEDQKSRRNKNITIFRKVRSKIRNLVLG